MDETLKEQLVAFMDYFEQVFGSDWKHTKSAMADDVIGHYIAESGTFLDPMIEGESSNWANRGALLAAYRNLAETMNVAGILRSPF